MIGVGTFTNSERIEELVLETLRSNRISYGPKTRELEGLIATIHGDSAGVASNSGTDSLRIALAAMKELYKWPDWARVVVPATTFVATANVVIQNNLTPVLVDVDPKTWNIDTGKLATAIKKDSGIVCVIPVSLFGNPAILEEINWATGDYVKVIHDACESMFAITQGTDIGPWADVTAFSLYVAHHIVAGVGGIATTSDYELDRLMRSLVNHGRRPVYISMDDRSKSNIKDRFAFDRIGYSSRMMELQSAIALAQLENWREMISARRRNAQVLMQAIDNLPLRTTFVREGDISSWMMFPIYMEGDRGDKYRFMAHLEECGVETRECLPLVTQPCYSGVFNPEKYPVSLDLIERSFYIACHHDLTTKELSHMRMALEGYYE